jgi:hypothetical protein
LNKFLEDPKKFLREVIFRYPFLSNENLIFWTIYHKILEISSNMKKIWKIVSLEDMKSKFLEEVKKYDLTNEELQRIIERWVWWIEWYYEWFAKNNREIFATEYNFSSRNIVFDWIPLTGKIDKIEILSDASFWNSNIELWQQALFTQEIALIDYKTWSVKRMWEIKWIDKDWNKKEGEWNYFRQLLFYKLMVENCSELNSKFKVWELALDFIEWKKWEYLYSIVDYTQDDFKYFKNELKNAWEKIFDIDFWKGII